MSYDDEFFADDEVDADTMLEACAQVAKVIVPIVGVTFFALGVACGWWLL